MNKMKNKTKNFHIIIGIVLIAVICCGLVSCSLNDIYFTLADDQYREAKLDKILDALQQEDMETIKSLFSKTVINEVGEDTIEEGIEYLFTVFEGDVVSYEMNGGSVSESIREGRRRKSTYINAVVTTDTDKYYVRCPDRIFDSITPDSVGIRYLVVMKADDIKKYGTPVETYTGVFRIDIIADALGEIVPGEEKLYVIFDALRNNDVDVIENLFSEAAKGEVGASEIVSGIKEFPTIFNGDDVTIGQNDYYINTNIEDGKVKMYFKAEVHITTDKGNYFVSYRDFIVDEITPIHVGLDQLEIVPGDEWPGYLDDDFVGVSCSRK